MVDKYESLGYSTHDLKLYCLALELDGSNLEVDTDRCRPQRHWSVHVQYIRIHIDAVRT